MSSKLLKITSSSSSGSADLSRKKGELKRQVVESVVNFSSQYGGDQSKSYSACNLAGEGYNFPNYGDFTQSFVLRTYGPWWNDAPSEKNKLFHNPSTFTSQDFVEIRYPEPVYPTSIEILETYNPGAVVRILACNCWSLDHQYSLTTNIRWFVLWSGAHQKVGHTSRRFSPPLKSCPFPTNLLRIEFNQSDLDYYAELDAIILYGHVVTDKDYIYGNDKAKPSILYEAVTLLSQLSLAEKFKQSHSCTSHHNGCFDILPSELITHILSFLDLRDLLTASGTCKLLQRHCYDSVWFRNLSLQPYWDKLNDAGLQGLQKRCAGTTEILNLSWSGGYDLISSQVFSRFITFPGNKLQVLSLACCKFLDHSSLQAIAKSCSQLKELDLRSCTDLPSAALSEIAKLTSLRKLNLYRVPVFGDVVTCIARSCPHLQHLNLGGCFWIQEYDEVVEEIARHCRDLRSIDLWRAKSLTETGINALALCCPNLEELDIGWCTNVRCRTGSVVKIAKFCTKLKKLFLTAVRTVSDNELEAISKCCPDMEQLDILGTALVTPDTVQRVLENCKKLKFLDISFCSQLHKNTVDNWRQIFSHVAIKKSFVNDEY